ncbi:RNA-binding protein 44 [Cyclopterus lumpus]|uniref:RNA-binding protein 44 n=1 Tax=Cyclopterus lumpus TaxID=8103 RepID=UPI001486273B|nr:RNA-binding protein 44 [Cyclopterus lumpus]
MAFDRDVRYETGWPVWSPYGYRAGEYAGVALRSHHLMPCFYSPVVQKPSPKEGRKFLLDRSVFDLVDDHEFLSLTDPKLLGWFLSLSPEDRKIILDDGGFQQFLLRHPSLALSPHHVYVKHMANAHLDSERRLSNVRETLNPLGCSNIWDEPRQHPTAFSSSITPAPNQLKASSHLNEQRPPWPASSSGGGDAVWKDSSALTSFSLDVDLERHRLGGQPEFRSQTAMTQWPSADCTYADVSLLQSDCPTGERDSSPEYYSFDSIKMDGTEYSSVLEPVEENRTEEGLRDHLVSGHEQPEGEDEAGLSFGGQSDVSPSNTQRDKGVLFCLTNKDVHSGAVCTDGGLTVGGQCSTKSAEKGTAPLPRLATCDVMVGSDAALCTSAVTQTEGPQTADKNVITEVHMSDLDYLAKEFTKLSMVQEKLRGQKEEIKSSTSKLRKECDCLQRAQRAELSLLVLQYSMCRQYCWKLHCTSSEGGRLTSTPENPFSNIESVLQKLESDYNLMSDEIRAGVPLEQLEPLSVEPEKITTRPSYSPAKIISDVLGNVPSRSSQEPPKHKTSGEENDCPNDQSSNGSQENEKRIKMENGRAGRAVPLVPQDGDAPHDAHKPGEKRTTASPELSACEAWYDAEEDLHRAGRGPTGAVKDETGESTSEEVQSSVLCVSSLPSGVTESDVTLWFEKHRSSEVSISALKNGLRVAMVTVSGPECAEAAVRELHGRCMQGRTLQVAHINRGSQRRASKDPTQPPSMTDGKPVTQPLLGSSVKNRMVVSISPTAKGTCVPQHYGTMGSFDTLMAELTQRHPAVGRQRMVDALMALRAEHGGVLSGLPLRTIREMTSELLTRPATATKL